uniref:Uncharacterized protein n=2 Tax=viral metagenome TaxID=1070528 RepID=A0A6M3LWF4_9ZZZZ
MKERKYRIGQIVEHKLSRDKLIILRNAMDDPCRISYIVRQWDLTTLEVVEEEIEEIDGG